MLPPTFSNAALAGVGEFQFLLSFDLQIRLCAKAYIGCPPA
jgi:hypothetical protein